MTNPFFDAPILNSPCEYPARHWELDEHGQPTQKIIENRRRAEFITPIPKPKKRKGRGKQEEIILRYMRQFYLAYRTPLLEGGATGAGKRNALRSESEKEAKRNAARSKSRIQRTAQGELPGLRPELSWSHYRLLLGIEDPAAREWYMNEAASQHWSTRQLDGGQWLDPDLPGLKLIHRRLPAA